MLGEVKLSKFPFEKLEFGLYTTSQLKKLLDVLDTDVDINHSKADDKVFSIHAQDKKSKVTYMCSDLSVIPSPPPSIIPSALPPMLSYSPFLTSSTRSSNASSPYSSTNMANAIEASL